MVCVDLLPDLLVLVLRNEAVFQVFLVGLSAVVPLRIRMPNEIYLVGSSLFLDFFDNLISFS